MPSEAKQAVLPLWGSDANARAVHLAAVNRFNDLCEAFVAADYRRDEERMDKLAEEMTEIVLRIQSFKRRQFKKWAKEREAQRR